MKWRAVQGHEHTIESDAGYFVLRCTANDIPTGRFVAFASRYAPIGGYDSREDAQSACDRHYYKTQQELAS